MFVLNDLGFFIRGFVDVLFCRFIVVMLDDLFSDFVIDLCDGGFCRNLGLSKVFVVNFLC